MSRRRVSSHALPQKVTHMLKSGDPPSNFQSATSDSMAVTRCLWPAAYLLILSVEQKNTKKMLSTTTFLIICKIHIEALPKNM